MHDKWWQKYNFDKYGTRYEKWKTAIDLIALYGRVGPYKASGHEYFAIRVISTNPKTIAFLKQYWGGQAEIMKGGEHTRNKETRYRWRVYGYMAENMIRDALRDKRVKGQKYEEWAKAFDVFYDTKN